MNVELGFISLAVLMGLLAMRVPIGLALIGVAVGGLYLLRGVNPAFSAAKVTPFEFVAHWTLSAIPMFILMGAIASNAGMIASIYAAARIWLRRLPGGLAIATSFAGAGFAAMSGSSLATTAAMSRIAVPEMLKSGYDPRLAAGVAAAVGTIGALTGAAEAVSAFLESIGIRQAESLDTLMDAPRLLSKMRLPAHRPRRLTVLTTTGGGGAMLVDQISARGVEIAGCSGPTREAPTAQNIPLGHGKLVDVTLAGTKYDTMKEVVSRLIADPETGALLVTIGSSAQFNPELAVTPIIDAVAEAPRDAAPVLAFPLPHAPESLDLLAAGGVPAFRNVEACAETIAMLMRPVKVAAPPDVTLQAATATLLDQGPEDVLNEDRAGAVFESLGIPRPRQIVLPPEDALPETLDLRFPLVAKLVSSDLPHKTEAGAIRLGLADRAALEEAIAAMRASAEAHAPGYRLEGILLQEMATGLGEALVGLTRDPLAGPMLTLGMGGVMTEIYRDTSVRPAPLDVETAREMIREVKGFMLLDGFRGALRGDLEALAQGVAAISALATSDRVAEAEINPLLVRPEGQGIVLLDALIRRQ